MTCAMALNAGLDGACNAPADQEVSVPGIGGGFTADCKVENGVTKKRMADGSWV